MYPAFEREVLGPDGEPVDLDDVEQLIAETEAEADVEQLAEGARRTLEVVRNLTG